MKPYLVLKSWHLRAENNFIDQKQSQDEAARLTLFNVVYSAYCWLWSSINFPTSSNCSVYGELCISGQVCKHLNPYQTHMSLAKSMKTQGPPTSQLCEKRALEKTSSQAGSHGGEKTQQLAGKPRQGDSAQRPWNKVINQDTDGYWHSHSAGQPWEGHLLSVPEKMLSLR